MTEPQFDESRPHPYVDPLQPNGTLTHQTLGFGNAVQRITVRNPIKRMRNGTRDGVTDWQATAEDLAQQLLGAHGALVASRGLVEQLKNMVADRETRLNTLQKQFERQKATIRSYQETYRKLTPFQHWLYTWWAFRLFASLRRKRQLRDI